MTDKLPPNLLALFAPRPALRYLPHPDHAPEERHTAKITPVGEYLEALRNYEDDYKPTESWLQRKDRIKQEQKEKQAKLLTEGVTEYKPGEDPQIKGDPYRTLFVARLSYDIEVKDLEREFGRFGPIERIRIVKNERAPEDASKKKKNRGYAFIVYEREKDMKAAYKETDQIRIKDRRVLVDVERGRTVSGWRPMRFAGGLGGRGYTKAAPARPNGPGFGGPPAGPGGFDGGFRGGFRGGRGGGFRGGFRGGFDGGAPRGGGFGGRGGFGGGRGGIGYQSNGFNGPSAPPEGAPAGPRGGGGGFGGRPQYGDQPNGGGYSDRGSGGRFDDRGPRGGGGGGNANMEPLKPRGGEGYRDRDRDGGSGGYGRDDYPRKRPYENSGYDDPRSKRRY